MPTSSTNACLSQLSVMSIGHSMKSFEGYILFIQKVWDLNGAHVAQESTKYLVNCIRFVGFTLCVAGPLNNRVGQAQFKYVGI